jgi:hypothetical protein
MKLVRDLLGLMAVILLGAGYLGSQVFYYQGEPARWAHSMDASSVRILAAILLLGAVVLSFFPEKEGE